MQQPDKKGSKIPQKSHKKNNAQSYKNNPVNLFQQQSANHRQNQQTYSVHATAQQISHQGAQGRPGSSRQDLSSDSFQSNGGDNIPDEHAIDEEVVQLMDGQVISGKNFSLRKSYNIKALQQNLHSSRFHLRTKFADDRQNRKTKKAMSKSPQMVKFNNNEETNDQFFQFAFSGDQAKNNNLRASSNTAKRSRQRNRSHYLFNTQLVEHQNEDINPHQISQNLNFIGGSYEEEQLALSEYQEVQIQMQQSQSDLAGSGQIRTTVISSDSVEQRGLKNKLGQILGAGNSNSPPTTMNRMNWLTYLKILFDQLEKHKEFNVSDTASQNTANNKRKSFFSTINDQMDNQDLTGKVKVDKVNRNQFVKGIQRIRNLLPLMNKESYKYRYPSEQGISIDQVTNFLMCQPAQLMSWDNIIDAFMCFSMLDGKASSIDQEGAGGVTMNYSDINSVNNNTLNPSQVNMSPFMFHGVAHSDLPSILEDQDRNNGDNSSLIALADQVKLHQNQHFLRMHEQESEQPPKPKADQSDLMDNFQSCTKITEPPQQQQHQTIMVNFSKKRESTDGQVELHDTSNDDDDSDQIINKANSQINQGNGGSQGRGGIRDSARFRKQSLIGAEYQAADDQKLKVTTENMFHPNSQEEVQTPVLTGTDPNWPNGPIENQKAQIHEKASYTLWVAPDQQTVQEGIASSPSYKNVKQGDEHQTQQSMHQGFDPNNNIQSPDIQQTNGQINGTAGTENPITQQEQDAKLARADSDVKASDYDEQRQTFAMGSDAGADDQKKSQMITMQSFGTIAGLSKVLPQELRANGGLDQSQYNNRNAVYQGSIPSFAAKDNYNSGTQKFDKSTYNQSILDPQHKAQKNGATINIQELLNSSQNDNSDQNPNNQQCTATAQNIVSFGTYDLRGQEDMDGQRVEEGLEEAEECVDVDYQVLQVKQKGQHAIPTKIHTEDIDEQTHLQNQFSQQLKQLTSSNNLQMDQENKLELRILDQQFPYNQASVDGGRIQVNTVVLESDSEQLYQTGQQKSIKKGNTVLPPNSLLSQFVTNVPDKSTNLQFSGQNPNLSNYQTGQTTPQRAKWSINAPTVANQAVQNQSMPLGYLNQSNDLLGMDNFEGNYQKNEMENYQNIDISSPSLRQESINRGPDGRIVTAKIYTHIDFTLSQRDFPLEQAVFKDNTMTLQFLNISFCKLKRIDDILVQCPNLRLLNASNNFLDYSSKTRKLPPLPLGLKDLILSYNQIKDISYLEYDCERNDMGLPSLQLLDISYNKILHVDQIPSLDKREDPYVSFMCVEGNDAVVQITKACKARTNLTKIVRGAELRRFSLFLDREVSKNYHFTTRLQISKDEANSRRNTPSARNTHSARNTASRASKRSDRGQSSARQSNYLTGGQSSFLDSYDQSAGRGSTRRKISLNQAMASGTFKLSDRLQQSLNHEKLSSGGVLPGNRKHNFIQGGLTGTSKVSGRVSARHFSSFLSPQNSKNSGGNIQAGFANASGVRTTLNPEQNSTLNMSVQESMGAPVAIKKPPKSSRTTQNSPCQNRNNMAYPAPKSGNQQMRVLSNIQKSLNKQKTWLSKQSQ